MYKPRRAVLCCLLLTLTAVGCSRQPVGVSHFAKGLACYKEGKFAKAAAHFEVALATMQTNALALNFLGVCHLEEGQTEAGLKDLQGAVLLDPNYVPARYNLALAQLDQGQAESAIANFREVVQSGSAPTDTRYHLGLAYMHVSAWGQAEDALKHYLESAPNSVPALNCLGIVAARKRDFAQAKRWFEQCIAADPKFATAYLNLASLEHHQLGQKKQALAHYEAYLDMFPKSQQREDVRLAMLQINQELAGAAKPIAHTVEPPAKLPEQTPPKVVETVRATRPVTPEAETVAPKLAATPSPAPAAGPTPPPPSVARVRTPVTVKKLTPGNRTKALAYFNEGVKFQQQGNVVSAIAAYDKAIAADPTFAKAYYNSAIAYRNAGQPERALENYELALAADPHYVDARFNYAILLQEQGYIDDAISQYSKILQTDPNDASAHLSVAGLYARDRATIARAREHYQAFLRLSPNSPLARDIRRWLDQNR